MRTWDDGYQSLKRYSHEFGDCNVPGRYKDNDGFGLGYWVLTQRRRQDHLTGDQREKLSELGFDWVTQHEKNDHKWHSMWERLCEYQDHHGDCDVPQAYVADADLGRWVAVQRKSNKLGTLTECRQAKLDSLGFDWEETADDFGSSVPRSDISEDEKWDTQYDHLVAFWLVHGHTVVPRKYGDDRKGSLGLWVETQRCTLKKNLMRKDRKEKLDRIGFVWSVNEMKWSRMLKRLDQFREDRGNFSVPKESKEHANLAGWVAIQRVKYRKGELSANRVNRLRAIGFFLERYEKGQGKKEDAPESPNVVSDIVQIEQSEKKRLRPDLNEPYACRNRPLKKRHVNSPEEVRSSAPPSNPTVIPPPPAMNHFQHHVRAMYPRGFPRRGPRPILFQRGIGMPPIPGRPPQAIPLNPQQMILPTSSGHVSTGPTPWVPGSRVPQIRAVTMIKQAPTVVVPRPVHLAAPHTTQLGKHLAQAAIAQTSKTMYVGNQNKPSQQAKDTRPPRRVISPGGTWYEN